MAEHKTPLTDQQIEQRYQQEIEQLAPAEAIDKHIQGFAKQQAKALKAKSTHYFWTATPWLASAASFACISVLGWWLWHKTAVAPVAMQAQFDHAFMETAPSHPVAAQQQMKQLPEQQPKAKVAQRMTTKTNQLTATGALEERSAASDATSSTLSGDCFAQLLAPYSPEQLVALTPSDNISQPLSAEYQLLVNKEINWQGQQWQLYHNNKLWVIKTTVADADKQSGLVVLPEELIQSCLSKQQ